MPNYAQGIYTPKNPQKYIGKHKPYYRSGWEMTFMIFVDTNKNVLYWASESISIPYIHPINGKRSNYIPDFFVVYIDKNGKQLAEVVEIKPKNQSIIESRVESATAARNNPIAVVNHAKWISAREWCKRNLGSEERFRLITENELFRNGRK